LAEACCGARVQNVRSSMISPAPDHGPTRQRAIRALAKRGR
ncbi:Cu(I)-responsive transcriptional regulator, partial [Methylobacterium radiotolerans]